MAWIEHLQSANWFQTTGSILGAYLLGCFATGYYLVRSRTGKDIRQIESGSTGARNVGRLLGRPGFGLTVLGDFGKGALAVWGVLAWTNNHQLAALAMLAVVAGHIWPAQLDFRGGKGVAPALGALLVFDYRMALTFAALFLAGLAVMRKTVLPGLFAFACLPLTALWFNQVGLTATLVAAVSAMILYAHRKNLTEETAVWSARRGVVPKPESPKL